MGDYFHYLNEGVYGTLLWAPGWITENRIDESN